MEVKYLDLGLVSPEIYTALWEYDNVIELNEPTFIKFSPNTKIVQFFQGPYWDKELQDWKNDLTNLSEFYNSENLKDVIISRCYIKQEIFYGAELAYYIDTPDVTTLGLFYPEADKRKEIDSIFHNSIEQIVQKRNIETKTEGNDIFFKHNNKYKKFSGSLYRLAANNWGYCDISITYDFDFEIANRVRTFDSKVKVKKFEVDDIKDMVGGLWEVDPTIDKDKMDLEVVTRVCKKLGLSIRNDSLTDEEESKLFERGHRRLTEKEWYLHGNNENFEIRY